MGLAAYYINIGENHNKERIIFCFRILMHFWVIVALDVSVYLN